MGYCVDDSFVRVDFFRASGKWYTSESIRWHGYRGNIHEEFAHSLREHFRNRPNTYSWMDAICLTPYNEHSHPVCIRQGGWIKVKDPSCFDCRFYVENNLDKSADSLYILSANCIGCDGKEHKVPNKASNITNWFDYKGEK